ncbi:MAG: ribosomal protein S5 domain 2-type protein, partial [Olpidium bornovanus]
MGTAAGGQPPPASSARADGRQCSDLRPPGCELALLERTDGSARYDCGDQTKVLVGVYGPVEVRQREELLDRATIQAVFRPLVGALSAAVNAATLALIDAGISLTELVAAATCAVTEDGVFLLDPTAKEAK